MAKKAPVKKSRRRLKRSVRRSLSAVLMITAIGVAAIPVPENRAEMPREMAIDESDLYVETITDATAKTEGQWNYTAPTSPDKVVYSLDIYEGGLYWQYKIDTEMSRVLVYNNAYPSTSLTLSRRAPINYTYVKKETFDSFKETSYTLKSDGENTPEAEKFFRTYFNDDDDYQRFLAAKQDPEAETVEVTRTVSDLIDSDQRTYYCTKNNMVDYILEPVRNEISDPEVLKQIGSTDAGTINSGDQLYIPKYIGEDSDANEIERDEKGYLLSSERTTFGNTQSITRIGAYAFAGSSILTSITLPQWLHEIGTGAFMDCYYLQSVNIPFLTEISDGAFKNCSALRTVDWWSPEGSSGLTSIGIEAFFGTGIVENVAGTGSVKFPTGLTKIDNAAFYNCTSLKSLEFEASSSTIGVSIGKYAFFDNTTLSSVNFNNKKVTDLGDYCMAVGVYDNALTSFTFPNWPFAAGKKILANRTNLQQITVPGNVSKLDGGILDGCTGLVTATFEGVNTEYDPALFDSVIQEDFYVTGPARMTLGATTDDVADASKPRKSTWNANKTAAGQNIPYLYSIGGKEYYEVCSGEGYLESIDKATGTLTSCSLKQDAHVVNGELVIPDKVGSTIVTRIDKDCFKGANGISSTVKSLVVGNNVLSIDDTVFKSWPLLSEVEIGKSIQKVGKEAFADCQNLKDVTFLTPDNYETLTIDTDAFATNSGQLTIHGDIVDGYAPFEYAMNPSQYIESTVHAGSTTKSRILYQSRWDSPSSKHMSVLYGEYDDGNGYVTLVDYPLHEDFYSSEGLSDDLEEHNRDMEKQFYNAYGNYAYPTEEDPYLEKKVKFAVKFHKDGVSAYEDDELYGPWINPSFCDGYGEDGGRWIEKKWLDRFGLSLVDSGAFDWLFKPITVMAASKPTAYFAEGDNAYNFLKNYKEHGGDRNLIVVDYKDGWTVDEQAMMDAVEKIVIPAGIESIDLKGFYEAANPAQSNVASNRENYILYFGDNSNSGVSRRNIFVYDVDDDKAGLFRGPIDDLYEDAERTTLEDDNIDKTEHQIGNDRIKSVDMSQSSVTSIPEYAFEDCELLETVLLPASCVETGALPFKDCERLTALESTSENLPAQNGILYQKKDDGSYELVECIQGKGLNGEGTMVNATNDDPYLSLVSSIGESAFENCQGVTAVDLSCIDNGASTNKLKSIPNQCFKNCDGLLSVKLPQSAHDIGQEAFANIREEYYYGKNSPTPRLEITITGSEFNISETAFDPKRVEKDGTKESTIDMVTIWTYEDTAVERYVLEQKEKGYDIRLGDEAEHQYLGKTKRVNFWDWNADVLCNAVYLPEGRDYIKEDEVPLEAQATVNEANHRPGYTFAGWLGVGGQKIGDTITGDEITYVAQYESDGTMVNGKYVVEFLDGIDGHQLKSLGANIEDGKYYVDAGTSFTENKFSIPTPEQHDGYQFKEWSGGFTENTVINGNMTVISLYSALPTSGGSTTNPSGNSTNQGGNNGNTTSNRSSSSTSTSSSTSSSSTSTSSTTSGSNSTVGKYTVTVENGSGSGSYDVGSTVVIAAADPAAGMKFQKWTTESNGVALASVSLPATTFTMPANNVTVTANYVEDTGTTAAPVSNTGGTTNIGTTTTGDGTDRVDITKPGISNKDLATADVNGSTDNFIVKITETDEATRAVADALTNKYGSLDNILYYAMDISLYDSTGTTKISDTTGLTVDITIPIPDALVAYGGNNMAGAVVNGNQLESLNESFTSINGVPCIRFTATHFSPYTIYVDTGNLTEGMIDTTPKTGDPIHPKWFLSIGLACLSVILFMKKDKGVKAKTA